MAQKKQQVLVKRQVGGAVYVWVDNPHEHVSPIGRIKGVTWTRVMEGGHICVYTDPRYDIDEIVCEIEALLDRGEKPDPLWEEVKNTIDTILEGASVETVLSCYQYYTDDSSPYWAWKNAIFLAAIAALGLLGDGPRAYPTWQGWRRKLRAYSMQVGFPTKEDIAQLDEAIYRACST